MRRRDDLTSQHRIADLAPPRWPQSVHERDRTYTDSYRVIIRLTVGVFGILLPIVFMVGEAFYLQGGFHVRGSLSAYYHTATQDIFVGGLCPSASCWPPTASCHQRDRVGHRKHQPLSQQEAVLRAHDMRSDPGRRNLGLPW